MAESGYWAGGPIADLSEWNDRPYDARLVTVKIEGQFVSRWLQPEEIAAFVQGRAYEEQRLDCTIWYRARS